MPLKELSKAIHRSVGTPLRAALDRLMCSLGLGPCPDTPNATKSVAFTVAIVALSAKMAKADGVVSQAEADAFQAIFHTDPNEMANVKRIFDLAKQDISGFESYAEQIAKLLDNEPQLKRDVFEGLFNIAASDGILHEKEESYLETVAEIFGIAPAEYRAIRARFVDDPDDAYTVLGLTRANTDAEIRTQYRRLVRETHPDALIARGVPKEFVDMADRKLAAINAAYEEIAQERGL
jgi:DnaJ like chaperone protein